MVQTFEGKKYTNHTSANVKDDLTVEEALQININSQPFTITMRTPGDDEDLIRGLLYSEDVYRSSEPIETSFERKKDEGITRANLILSNNLLKEGYQNSRNLLSISSCGFCGKKELENPGNYNKVDDNYTLELKNLFQMFEQMRKQQVTFEKSGGSHAAAIFNLSNQLLCVKEDIGRHNAVDKAIGYLINKKKLNEAKCLLVSGRISYEIITKAFSAKIPILCSVSAPSSLSVDFAKELGITLVAFCRSKKATCYANPERISD